MGRKVTVTVDDRFYMDTNGVEEYKAKGDDTGIGTGDQQQAAANFTRHDEIGEEARETEAFEKTDGAGRGENENLEQAVGEEQHTEADAQQCHSVLGLLVRHVSLQRVDCDDRQIAF